MSSGLRKSIYLFLSCLLGSLLFVILQRIAVFAYIVLLSYGFGGLTVGMSWVELLALDYMTMLIALLFGGWYGIWVGIHWYESVYEHGTTRGLIGSLVGIWPRVRKPYNLKTRVEAVSSRLESDLGELEALAKSTAAAPVAPKKRVVRRVVRKKAVAV
jgi:hypothetical protein